MLHLTTDYSAQISTLLDKLISSGVELGERLLGALIVFIIGKFLVNWLNKLFAKLLVKQKVDISIQTFLKSMMNILLLVLLVLAVIGQLGIELTGFAALLASAGVAIGMAKKEKDLGKLRIISLGGLNEVGKNITVIEHGNDIIIVDCGLAFPTAELLGVDIVIPDFTHIENNYEKVKGEYEKYEEVYCLISPQAQPQ